MGADNKSLFSEDLGCLTGGGRWEGGQGEVYEGRNRRVGCVESSMEV